MPPAKARATQDDSKTEVPQKGKHAAAHDTVGRARRNGGAALVNGANLRDTVPNGDAASLANGNGGSGSQSGNPGIPWSSESRSLLQRYRTTYRLDTPAAFDRPLSYLILGNGIGRYSPTMARHAAKRRQRKEQLALAVRKNFNGLAVSENEVIVDLLYSARTQDKTFRMSFAPPRPR